ncbi:sulfatase [Allofournierella sp.]|uniref:sulfatase n=1 Tax=Allofournierella sp. TaxID=1940256 RepID=UPI003AB52223
MKAIMITFDSLNRHMLPNYGNDWVQAPFFRSLQDHCTTYDRCYVGSMPCMPARRELHTGRENFLHCPWGPLEPFDESVPQILHDSGIHTHLVTDHYHYWEDAGFAYHNRYSSYRFSRGQEGDPVYGDAQVASRQQAFAGLRVPWLRAQDQVNREHIRAPEEFPQAVTFGWGLEFLQDNWQKDNWFLHIETFDPHEPFYAPDEFRALYGLSGLRQDWPDYGKVSQNAEAVERIKKENAALVSFCDYNLGRVLRFMDEHELWKDTLLIVHTDHGFLLGEHGWMGKNVCPYYDEVAHIPLFLHVPGKKETGRSERLTQTVDLPVTLLDWFGLNATPHMTGNSLLKPPQREFGIFGTFGGQLCATNGRYVYMRGLRQGKPLFAYTLAGLHFGRIPIQRRDDSYTVRQGRVFGFSKGFPLMQVEDRCGDYASGQNAFGDLLFDLENDPGQAEPLCDPRLEAEFLERIRQKLQQLEAPGEVYDAYEI